MRPRTISVTCTVIDRDGICAAQKPTGAGNLTIAGAYATGGVATLTYPGHVSIYGGSDESGDTFTITGTDRFGVALTEEITGPNATTVKGDKNFKTVTQVATDGAATGNVEVGTADEFESQLIPVDIYGGPITYHVNLSSAASLEYRVECTLTDVQTDSFQEDSANFWYPSPGWTTEETENSSVGPIVAIRLAIRSWVSGTATLEILQSRG